MQKIFTSIKKSVTKSWDSLKEKAGRKQVVQGKNGTIKVNRNLSETRKAKKDARARKKAAYLATLPKSRVKRFFYRMHPKRFFKFWFSREGLILGLKITGIGIAVMMLVILGVFAYFRKDLPKNTTELKACFNGQTTEYYDRTGTILLWSSKGDIECTPVDLDKISKNLQNAVIAVEDRDFYKHGGFSVSGIFRAAVNNFKGSGGTQGGSTITQQFVKNALLTNEQKISRKIKELILAIELERSFSKDEILNAYLNTISFGDVYEGAEAAAKGYFNKSASELTIDEAALLAAVIPAPTYYSPTGDNVDELITRQKFVIQLMQDQGFISKEEADSAKSIDTLAKLSKNRNKYKDIKAPHFVLYARDILISQYGETLADKAGYKVITTIDMDIQKIAEEAVAMGMQRVDAAGFDNAALTAEDVTTGEVVAMVGSRDFFFPGYGEKNIAVTPRSPGSSFKPYDYAALMESSENWGAGSIMYDLSTNFGGGYQPKNYDFREPGGVPIRYALGGSRNIPAIKAMYISGISKVHEVAERLGMKEGITGCSTVGERDCGEILSTALGDGGQVRMIDHVHAYASFSRLGKNIPQKVILRIEDNKGKVVQDNSKTEEGTQAIDPQIAYIINDMLSDKRASYFRIDSGYANFVTNGFEGLGIPAAMKTGTTNNVDNGWLMGHTSKYATGVWIGHHENQSANTLGFENITAPIWGEFMRRVHERLPEKPGGWARPEGIKEVSYDSDFYNKVKAGCTGALLGAICSYPQTDIYPSWYVSVKQSSEKAVIDTISNKLATECTPERAKKEITGGAIRAEIPNTDPNYSGWAKSIASRYSGAAGGGIPTEKDDVHKCDDVKPDFGPGDAITVNELQKGVYDITVNFVQGTHPLQTLNLKIEGQIVQSYAVSTTGSVTYRYTSTIDGINSAITAELVDSALYENTSNPTSFTFELPEFEVTIDASDDTPLFDWTYQGFADNYEICVSTQSCISDNSPDYEWGPDPLPSGDYTVYVKAFNSGSEFIRSKKFEFSIP